MELLKQLLSDDVGLFSVVTIVFATIVVSVCIGLFIKKANSRDDK